MAEVLDRIEPKEAAGHEPLPVGRVPLYRTIADSVIRDIRKGRLSEGERIPPSREMARKLEVNRATIHQALQVLKAEGWIETNKGGGTRIARRSAAAPVLTPSPLWDQIGSALLGRITREGQPSKSEVPVVADLSRFAPDEKDFPAEIFAGFLAEVAKNGSLLAYGSPFGYRPLRETLAERLSRRGVSADPDAILIVNGAQQGLDLITRALVDPGDPVAVEDPSYSGALTLLRAYRARLLDVPLDAEGPDTKILKAAFREKPKFFYTIPDFQNPTGKLYSPARRHEIVSAAVAAGVPVVEDAFDADLLVEGELPPPLAALAPSHVIHLGTISKALFPGVRVGWIAGPKELIHRLAALKRVGELTSPSVLQAALHLFIVRGEYDRHLFKVRARLKARLTLASRVIQTRFPAGTVCHKPSGGYVLWIEMPEGVSGRELTAEARERGILVSPGADFHPAQEDGPCLRISVARSGNNDLENALEEVAAIARSLVRQAHRRKGSGPAENRRASEEALIQV
jgi:DNA-binding transcriptional MocR family regulator